VNTGFAIAYIPFVVLWIAQAALLQYLAKRAGISDKAKTF
jgi:hypothetical protein